MIGWIFRLSMCFFFEIRTEQLFDFRLEDIKMRVALLSNVTVDLLADMVKKTNSVYISAGFDTWQQIRI